MRKWKMAGVFLLAFCMAASPLAAAVRAFGASPDFAYTEEKWSSLQDNKLEYEEISDLIHEYNTTVLQNELDYQEYKGKTSSDLSKDYYDSANEILERIEYPADDDTNYASGMTSALNSQIQADDMTEQGDNNVDDGEIKRLGYEQAEKQLVKQAQGLMITWQSGLESMESLEDAVTQAENSYVTVQNQIAAGTAVTSSLESAGEAVTTAKAAVQSAKTSLEKTKEQLCIMLGWSYGSEVEFGELPEPDLAAIEAIDITADIQTALTNNYSIRITERRIANSQSDSNKTTYGTTYTLQKDSASTSVKNLYNSLLLARDSYEQAKAAYELEESNVAAAKLRLSAGTITQKTYDKQVSSSLSASVKEKTEKLKLLQAKLEYDWAVAGLASVS